MKERPILFSAPIVRALLEDRKTQTRRIIKPQPVENEGMNCRRLTYFTKNGKPSLNESIDPVPVGQMAIALCPYGDIGDRLWVREAFCTYTTTIYSDQGKTVSDPKAIYRADNKILLNGYKWKPSIFMPRWASRITLEITDVRVQRLKDINEEDARAEGAIPFENDPEGDCWTDGKHKTSFNYLWNEINGWVPNAWDANPWVWAITFKRVEAAERAA